MTGLEAVLVAIIATAIFVGILLWMDWRTK